MKSCGWSAVKCIREMLIPKFSKQSYSFKSVYIVGRKKMEKEKTRRK